MGTPNKGLIMKKPSGSLKTGFKGCRKEKLKNIMDSRAVHGKYIV
jgi:hypothetical protein